MYKWLTKKNICKIGIVVLILGLFLGLKLSSCSRYRGKSKPIKASNNKRGVKIKRINRRGDQELKILEEDGKHTIIIVEPTFTNHKMNILTDNNKGKVGYAYEVFHINDFNFNIGICLLGPYISGGFSITPALDINIGTFGPGFSLRF